MHRVLTKMKTIHYADDSTIYSEFKKGVDCSSIVNNELESLRLWLETNKLHLNVGKTKYMILNNMSKPPDLNLKIGASSIERTDTYKFLGLILDDRLTFADHVNKLCSKIARNIGVIRRLSLIVPNDVLKNLYYAFVHSYFTYALTSYASATVSVTGRLSRLIDKSIKLITGANRLTPEIYREQNILNFTQAYKYFSSIKIFRIMHLDDHNYFLHKILLIQYSHNHNTRNSTLDILKTPRMYFSKCQRSFLYAGINIWNSVPVALRDLNEYKK